MDGEMTRYHYPEWMTDEEKERLMRYNKWVNGQQRIDANKTYKMIHDPTDSWGYSTHLSREDINNAIRYGSIERGCRFLELKSMQIFEIVQKSRNKEGYLLLERIKS